MDGDRPGLLERAPWVRRHKLDVGGYYAMAEAGILGPEERVELIEGEIVDMVPIGSGHSGTVTSLARRMILGVGDRATVTIQGPLRLSDHSEPEPDLLLVKFRADDYREAHPTPADVLLLIEVAESSLRFDHAVKLPLYARHGIPEVWIVNLVEGVVEVHRDPDGETWRTTFRAGRHEVLEPEALPDVRLDVATILR